MTVNSQSVQASEHGFNIMHIRTVETSNFKLRSFKNIKVTSLYNFEEHHAKYPILE